MDKRLLRILESGVRAPTADNRLPVRFRVSNGQVDLISADPVFESPCSHRQRLALLSLGAIVESMAITASENGLELGVRLFGNVVLGDPVVRLELHQCEEWSDELAHSIPHRHTNRRPFYRGQPMSERERRRCEAATARFEREPSISWLNEPHIRREAVSLIGKAETERFRNRALHAELFSAIRFDKGWKADCEEGLPPGALAVEPMFRPIFGAFRNWTTMRAAQFLGMHHVLGFRSATLPCRVAPDLAALTVRELDPASIFAAGRAFMRIWLTVTSLDRVLQPLPASALYALGGIEINEISDELRDDLARNWKRLIGTRIPIMVFRIGKARPLDIVARRPELSSLSASARLATTWRTTAAKDQG